MSLVTICDFCATHMSYTSDPYDMKNYMRILGGHAKFITFFRSITMLCGIDIIPCSIPGYFSHLVLKMLLKLVYTWNVKCMMSKQELSKKPVSNTLRFQMCSFCFKKITMGITSGFQPLDYIAPSSDPMVRPRDLHNELNAQ